MEKTVFQQRVEQRLADLKTNPSRISLAIGKSDSFVRDILRKGTVPKGDNLALLADALSTTADYLFGNTDDPKRESPRVRYAPIVGKAGAGPEGSVLFAEGHGNFGEIEAPAGASDSTEALEVQGDSMHGLANDGWMIFYDEKMVPGPDHMGEPCVCWLANGRVLIKTPYPGSQRGLFNLISINAPTMPDVAVDAMALITDIKTRKAAQKYLRRNPTADVGELHISRSAG